MSAYLGEELNLGDFLWKDHKLFGDDIDNFLWQLQEAFGYPIKLDIDVYDRLPYDDEVTLIFPKYIGKRQLKDLTIGELLLNVRPSDT